MCGKRTALFALLATCALPTVATTVPGQTARAAQDIKVNVTSSTEAVVTWTTSRPMRSTLEFDGVIPPYHRRCRVSDYAQAVIYAPEVHGDALSADLIDRDLLDIRAANANAINLYGLGSPGLQKRAFRGAGITLEEHLLRKCRQLQLAVIARIEWYPATFTFDVLSASLRADADAVLSYYARSIERIRRKCPGVLLYYLVNMPMDDTFVQDRLAPARFPTAVQQRDYVRYMRQRLAEMHPEAPVRVVVHWGALDTIPVAKFSDLADGLALVAYPVRCSAAPFTAGLPQVDCGRTPGPYNGPSLEDPANVIIGKDQLDYWLEKTRFINELTGARGLAMDGVGFAERLGHWSGIVNDHATKVQATKWLADYLADEHRTDGFSYFMFHD
ncbi:MAG: hypothetical protein Q7T82_13700, partial [Armatimonadota bacterium]|nr:hypothetical protein [Armatimonadota bacterium]